MTASDTEFWRDITPLGNVFKPGAVSEVYVPDHGDDERFFIPINDTVSVRPLFISPGQNSWSDIMVAKQPGLIHRHYHPHSVRAYTISGKWGYLEHDWVATTGDFVYEAPGESHTLVTYDCGEPTRIHFNVTGPMIYLDESGDPSGQVFDAFAFIELAREHCEKVGIGADYVDTIVR